ncbi:hypothetical protein AAF712_012768 [Marasmius tenuissimus]|uniref:Uncharacterized protein n=1 Tax=Marasmius tenuissimus TaxID=585030 RepID=A0ABR2ZFU6_9AGAR
MNQCSATAPSASYKKAASQIYCSQNLLLAGRQPAPVPQAKSTQVTVPKAGAERPLAGVKINVDEKDSSSKSDEELSPPKRKRPRDANNPAQSSAEDEINQRLDAEEEPKDNQDCGGTGSGLDTGPVDGECEDDTAASRYISDKAMHFTVEDDQDETHPSHSRAHSRTSGTDNHGPPTSDFNSNNVPDIQDRNVPMQEVSAHKAKQLQYELPQVDKDSHVISWSATQNIPSTTTTTSTTPANIKWLSRTDIIVTKKGRTYKLQLTSQPPLIRTIIEKAIARGKLMMLLDHTYLPLSPEGTKQIAQASLVKIADMDGYDGGGGILHCLEEGNLDQYIKPLRRKAGELAQNRTFLYPLDIHGWLDYQRPLDHPVIPTYINKAFISQTLYSGVIKQYGTFLSSDSKKPDELEIYACLQDQATATKDPFPNKDVNGVWHLAVELLEKLENAKPSKYHTLMHNIYKQATEKRGYQHVTNLQVLQATDWSAIEQESDEDEDSTTAEHPSMPLEPTNVHSEGCNTGTSAAAMPE